MEDETGGKNVRPVFLPINRDQTLQIGEQNEIEKIICSGHSPAYVYGIFHGCMGSHSRNSAG